MTPAPSVPAVMPEASTSFVSISWGNVVAPAASGKGLLNASLGGGLALVASRRLLLASLKGEIKKLSDASFGEGFGAKSLRNNRA